MLDSGRSRTKILYYSAKLSSLIGSGGLYSLKELLDNLREYKVRVLPSSLLEKLNCVKSRQYSPAEDRFKVADIQTPDSSYHEKR